MKVIKTLGLVAVLALSIGAYAVKDLSENECIALSDVEAISDCEIPNGVSANGHCVKNDRNEYFCARSSWWQSDNCYQ